MVSHKKKNNNNLKPQENKKSILNLKLKYKKIIMKDIEKLKIFRRNSIKLKIT